MKDTRDRSEYKRAYRLKNLEVLKERHRKWRLKNPDKKYANDRKWRAANPDWVREYEAKWRDKNRVKINANRTASYRADPEKHREATRKYRRKALGIPTPPRPASELCECCGRPQLKNRVMALDHCHDTGKFRGWLCNRCNTALGLLGDTLEAIDRAKNYLLRAYDA